MDEIVFDGVRKRFGKVEALRGVTLSIPRGAFAVILGPSGCGKSTLLRALAGLERVSDGRVLLGGEDITNHGVGERDVAMVFQNYALYPHLSVAENMGYALKVAGMRRAERHARVAEVAEKLQIAEYLDRLPGQLSGGQRQRVAMGRAIVRNPRVFLFDEPLSNLDAKLRVQMRIEIKRLHRRQGATSLFVTHDQIEAMSLADILIVMNDGKVEQVGTPTDLYHGPATAFVASFLGNPPMSLLTGRIGAGRDTVILDSGISLDLGGTAEAPAGTLVALGIRPEHVQLGAGPQAEVEFVEELGNGRLVHLSLDGQVLSALTTTGDARVFGTRAGVSLPREHLHLFHAETERVVRVTRETRTVPA